jgi:carboxyl-terminal processing protease
VSATSVKWFDFVAAMRIPTILLTGVLAWTCAGADKAALTADQRRLAEESFEYVWTTVRDKHWDPKLGGLDWQKVHDELRPALDKATTMDQARDVMSRMLEKLKQTHFGIIPGEVYTEMKGSDKDQDGEKEETGMGSPGIQVRVVDGHALVTDLSPESPAAGAGIKPGWEIVKVDGKPVDKGLRLIAKDEAGSTLLALSLMSSVAARLSGDVGTDSKVEFRDGAGRRVERTLGRVEPRGAVAHMGSLPPLHFWVEQKKVRPDVGYLRFNMFFEPDALMKAVSTIMKDCAGCKGFVVDLRGNPGGIGALASGLAGWFTDHAGTQLGTMYMRTGQIHFAVFARPEPFRGPLAVLVDGCSASTSEIFAGGMQDLKRARIFGTRTAGAALPSMIERLPDGDGFQYAFANYISQGGKVLEGSGVTPDEEVKLTQRDLLDGKDRVLEHALAWIDTQK